MEARKGGNNSKNIVAMANYKIDEQHHDLSS